MHTDLRRILASERVGGFKEGHQHLIEPIAIVYNMAVISLMRNHIFLDKRLVILSKQLTDNGYSFWAGDTYNSNGAHAMRCSDCADSVVI